MNTNYMKVSLLCISCLLCVAVSTYYFTLRGGLHLDESLSLILSSYSDYGWTKVFTNENVTGSQLRQLVWFGDTSISGTANAIINLWIDNRDSPHSNLYYSALRLWFVGFDVNQEPYNFMWRAFYLNLLLVVGCCYLLFNVTFKLFKNAILSSILVVLAICNDVSVSNVIYLRPYLLQTLLVFAYIYSTISILQDFRIKKTVTFKYALSTSLALLSGYFAIIFVAILGSFSLAIAFHNFNKKDVLKFCYSYLPFTAVLSFLIYPPYFFVFGNRQEEAVSKLGSVWENIISSANSVDIWGNAFAFPLTSCAFSIVLALFHYFKVKDNESRLRISIQISLLVSAILWMLLVEFFAPYKTARYIYPVIPLLAISLGIIWQVICTYSRMIGMSYILLMSAACLFTSFSGRNVEYLYPDREYDCSRFHNEKVAVVTSQPWALAVSTECFDSTTRYSLFNSMEYVDYGKFDFIISEIDLPDNKDVKLVSNRVMYAYKMYKVIK
ncbi:MAG: hypothetical protein KH575_22400 [Enterobacter sp.]|uniref:hypothetical protein n=1 Tax=Enterobacter sp. TaxID=42895 RepID=UPI00258EDD09|nr:hypothetical protein [Enterobacter sp.]MBS6391062.1 hypothetical protein [Enterobacter sp.]